MTDPDEAPPAAIDTTVPHSPRIWNYWLGGRDNYAVDREAGDQYREVFPGIVDVARMSRAFLTRAVTLLGHTSAPAAEIDRRVSLRLQRQDLLTGPEPPQVWSVIDEGALRRPVGGRAVMAAQLRHLADIAALRQVTIQVIPFGRGGHAAAGGSFSVLRFGDPDVPDVVYLEHLTSALYLDSRDDVDHYLEVMNHLSTEALTPAASTRFIAEITKET